MSTSQYVIGILHWVINLLMLYVILKAYKEWKNTENNSGGKSGNVENKGGSLAEGVMGLREQLSYHERQCANRHEEFMRQLRAIGAALGASRTPPAAPQQD